MVFPHRRPIPTWFVAQKFELKLPGLASPVGLSEIT